MWTFVSKSNTSPQEKTRCLQLQLLPACRHRNVCRRDMYGPRALPYQLDSAVISESLCTASLSQMFRIRISIQKLLYHSPGPSSYHCDRIRLGDKPGTHVNFKPGMNTA